MPVERFMLSARRRARRLAPLLLLLLPLLLLAAAWLAAQALVVRAPLSRADALFVFSGSADYVERTRKAAELFREGRAPLILLTDDRQQGGWSNAEERNPFFVERARSELVDAGVPPEKIEILPQAVTSTYDEAVALRDYAKARGLNSILAVTSAYHTRRALWTLRKVFAGSGTQIGIETPSDGTRETPPAATWWLHRKGWEAVAGEYPKFVSYWLRYR